jgi:hypothetical protein
MYAVEVYATVRQLVFAEGLSRREVARRLGLSRDTVGKMRSFSEPPGYVRTKPVERPKLGPLGRGSAPGTAPTIPAASCGWPSWSCSTASGASRSGGSGTRGSRR